MAGFIGLRLSYLEWMVDTQRELVASLEAALAHANAERHLSPCACDLSGASSSSTLSSVRSGLPTLAIWILALADSRTYLMELKKQENGLAYFLVLFHLSIGCAVIQTK